MVMNVRESIMEIGKPTPLVGVLTESGMSGDTGVILLNSGIMHRVGSCRLSVRLARQLAEATGFTCLRFDFSGVGDSRPRRSGGAVFEQVAVDEVIEAMDHLRQTRGIRKFILYGLCSGARIACNAAERDARVIAVIQLDGFCYPTPKAYALHYWRRLWSVGAWKKRYERWLGIRRNESIEGSILTGEKADFEVPEFAEDPGRDAIGRQLQGLMKRGVKLHCVFTGFGPYYCYQNQFRDCFSNVDFGSNLNLEYFPDASHIFTEPLYQAQMIDGIVRWASQFKQVAPSHRAEAAVRETELEEAVSW